MSAYTATLRGFSIGAGTVFDHERAPTGLGPGAFVTQRQARVWADGVIPSGPDTLRSRVVSFEVMTPQVLTAAAAELLADGLKAAWGAPVREGVLALSLQLAGVERVLFGRPVSCDVDFEWLPQGHVRARCVFEATDPRLFSASEQSVVLGLNAGGGVTAPVTAPVTAGAGSDQDASVTNAGGFDTVWRAVIAGPVTTPRLTLGETGEFVELNGTIPAGSTVIVESSDGSVLLDGSPRQNWPTFPSSFFALPSGTSTVRFRAASGSGTCTFSWRDADL